MRTVLGALLAGAMVMSGQVWAQDSGIDWSRSIDEINRALQADIDQSPLPSLDPQGKKYTILKPTAIAAAEMTDRTRTRVDAPPCPSGWALDVQGDGWVCISPCPPHARVAHGACVTCPDAFRPARIEAGWICMTCQPDASVRPATAVDQESCVSGPGQTPGEREDDIMKSLMRDALGGGGTASSGNN